MKILDESDKLLGEVVLIRTHNNDFLPAIVTTVWGNDIINVICFDEHYGGNGKLYTKIKRDTGACFIEFMTLTWLPKGSVLDIEMP